MSSTFKNKLYLYKVDAEVDTVGERISSMSPRTSGIKLGYSRASVKIPEKAQTLKKGEVSMLSHLNHVEYDYENARFMGVPKEWQDVFNKQFG